MSSADPANLTDLTGIWRSRYVYPSSRGGEREDEHVVEFSRSGDRWIGVSAPQADQSKLRIELVIEDQIATGTWRESTSPTRDYQGAVYHGAIQLVITPSELRGRWIGFSRNANPVIQTGTWDFFRQDQTAAD